VKPGQGAGNIDNFMGGFARKGGSNPDRS